MELAFGRHGLHRRILTEQVLRRDLVDVRILIEALQGCSEPRDVLGARLDEEISAPGKDGAGSSGRRNSQRSKSR
ncbi:hypothetical protein DYH09_17070 [bacterium CPR1]|nr:hypothetical protein [bacterium CPR1]